MNRREKEERRKRLEQLIGRETQAITAALNRRGVNAGTSPALASVFGGSYIRYQISLGPSETVAKVASRLPEIDEALYRIRPNILCRLGRRPLSVEVPHPDPYPLLLPDSALPELDAHTMLIGREYLADGPQDITISLPEFPHGLVAGITGAGKSVQMKDMVFSLAWNTSPADLQIWGIDLKNEDGQDLGGLPHVQTMAYGADDAKAMVERVYAIKEERVKGGRWAGPGLLLIIDELADLLLAYPELAKLLGSLGSIGRSKGIYLLVGTQKPNRDSVGAILKANLAYRCVGMVGDTNESYQAGGLKELEAHLLPGKGSFLLIAAGRVRRYQAYYISTNQLERHTRKIRAKWTGVQAADVGGTISLAPIRQAQGALLPVTGAQSGIAAGNGARCSEPDSAVATVAAALQEYVTRRRSRAEVWALAEFVVAHYATVAGGDWSKAELIRQAYDRGLITSSVTGGGNARLFGDALAAAALVDGVTDMKGAGAGNIATTDDATRRATGVGLPLAKGGQRSDSSSGSAKETQ